MLFCWSFFFWLDSLFLLFPVLAAPELLYFDFLVSEILFFLIAFLSSSIMNAFLA